MAGSWNGTIFTGDDSDDVASGTGADETLLGLGGADSLAGAGGDDTLDGGTGDDTLTGGNGNDRLTAGDGADRAGGGEGDDTLAIDQGDAAVDTVSGGNGNDVLSLSLLAFAAMGGGARITGDLQTGGRLFGGGTLMARLDGFEALAGFATQFDDTLIGGAGNDALTLLTGSDRVQTGTGDDSVTLACDSGLDNVDLGAGGTDTIVIVADGGGDVVFDGSGSAGGAASSFRVDGITTARIAGAERLVVTTGNGDDRLTGGALDDLLSAGGGFNRVNGRGGADEILLSLDDEKDTVDGGGGRDTLTLTESGLAVDMSGSSVTTVKVRLDGVLQVSAVNVEKLRVAGSDLADLLLGLDLGDSLSGGDGDDVIRGRAGADTIEGGDGADTLTGGAGPDTFQFLFLVTGGVDTVADFGPGDSIEVDVSAFGGLSAGDPAPLEVGFGPGPVDGNATFLYDLDTGLLSYDSNGTGDGGLTELAFLLNGGISGVLDASQILLI